MKVQRAGVVPEQTGAKRDSRAQTGFAMESRGCAAVARETFQFIFGASSFSSSTNSTNSTFHGAVPAFSRATVTGSSYLAYMEHREHGSFLVTAETRPRVRPSKKEQFRHIRGPKGLRVIHSEGRRGDRHGWRAEQASGMRPSRLRQRQPQRQ